MLNRRNALKAVGAAGLLSVFPQSAPASVNKKLVFKNGIEMPVIGMGTWLTFNVAKSSPEIIEREKVLKEFFARGGGMIDSSPMYGRSEAVIGHLRQKIEREGPLFSATKIWTPLSQHGKTQVSNSHELWHERVLDLVHVHNLLNWRDHIKTLRSAREAGTVRYIGLTTSHGRRHEKLETLIKSEDIDAVQFSYNILNRKAETRLLPAALDKGLAVIINRPFMTGALFDRVKGIEVPEWAQEELGVQSWAEYFLKFVISHPAVTCAIPATRNPAHMIENMRAGTGETPDKKIRQRMITDFEGL